MSEQQYRLWQDIIKTIDNFLANKIDFQLLVTSLEPPLDAAPIKDKEFLHEWYELWEPLEIKNAVDLDKGVVTKQEDVKENIDTIKRFFLVNLNKVRKL